MALAFALGLAASLYGSITGGAGMLSLPGLMMLGLPPDVAIASNKLGDLGRFSAAGVQFARSGKVNWRYVGLLAPLGVAGGYAGARLLLQIDPGRLATATGVMMLAMLPMLFARRDLGTVAIATGRLRRGAGVALYLALVVYGAGIQLGAGPFILYLMMMFFGFTILQANATSSICWLFITVSSLATYVWFGIVDYRHGLALLGGSAIGGYLGARIALGKGERWTRNLFAAIIVILALRLLFF